MESHIDHYTARALLEWQIEFGVDETISETPINRYDVVPEPKKSPARAVEQPVAPAPKPVQIDPVKLAIQIAQSAEDIAGLRAALEGFEHCDLKRGARNMVFNDGICGADLMIIGEAPGLEEDREGRSFVGGEGVLLDKMLAAIGMSRTQNAYLVNVMPWRPPQSRPPKPGEIAMMLPFLARHVALAKPKVLVLMGNTSCQAVLGKRGITRLRGDWTEAFGVPALPMMHPEQLMKNPAAKRDAWADLLALKAKLKGQ